MLVGRSEETQRGGWQGRGERERQTEILLCIILEKKSLEEKNLSLDGWFDFDGTRQPLL